MDIAEFVDRMGKPDMTDEEKQEIIQFLTGMRVLLMPHMRAIIDSGETDNATDNPPGR